jgi:ribonuclease R
VACQLFFTLFIASCHPSQREHLKDILVTRKTPPQSGKGQAGNGQDSGPTKGRAKPAGRAPRTSGPSKPRNKASGVAARDPHAAREARKYERPIPSREAILALLEERGELLTEARIAEALEIFDETDLRAAQAARRDGARRPAAAGASRRLCADAEARPDRRRGAGQCRGLRLSCVPDAGGDDLYLSPQQMRAVMHGDRVLASVVGIDRRGRAGRDCRSAAAPLIAAGWPRGRRERRDLVTPDDRRLHQDVMIKPGKEQGARATGQIVVVEITDPPTAQRGPNGRDPCGAGRTSAAVTGGGDGDCQPRPAARMAAEVLRDAAQVEPEVSAAEREGRTISARCRW